ncbi:uncharacterized protein K02A2.6-like, partial [Diaphorina citri]|uniref:RNA-directed DNA polymerase n=1 Tax=Diaphorina citri TaxID=121845 RepID=A0A1S3DS60_DIACI
KPSKELRVCLDPIDLNSNIEREYYLIPTLEQIKYKLAGKQIFSVIDLKDGFHQIPLSKKSSELCTFSTPFGYFKYLRLPFGLVSSPEVFMKINTKYFGDIEDVMIYFDDILVASADKESHMKTLDKLFSRAQELNVKFNLGKLQLMKNEIKFLGHIFNKQGCQPDRERISSVLNLKPPNNIKELQSVLGMFNYLRDFIPNMAEITSPLRNLLRKSTEWHWANEQQVAFQKLKDIVSKPPILRNFNPNLPATIQCDSSQNGMGCVLLQENQPVAFASRSLTDTEKSYPQIEKELLSILFSCKRFHNYIWGSKITVQTDHLPLVSIFKKNLCKIVSNRCTKMRLAVLQYNLDVTYLPGTKMYIADLLSRNFVDTTDENEMISKNHIHNLYQEPTLLNTTLVGEHTLKDPDLSKVLNFTSQGWPNKKNMLPKNEIIRHFHKLKNELIVSESVLYYNDRMVIPNSLKRLALQALHVGHLGVTKTILRAKDTMYWININNDIESFIKNCFPCQENLPQKTREPLIPHELPKFPFQTLFIDIMTYNQSDYLVIIDQYSKWIELFQLNSKKCKEIIKHLKLLFASKGVAKSIVSDNSPFNSEEINQFCKEYGISWKYSSPLHPISHGLIERAVGICKNLLKKAKHLNCDYLELLAEYRATPIPALGVSPSEMLMGRLINTKIPVHENKLKPIGELSKVHESVLRKMNEHQKVYKSYYDKKSKVEKPFEKGENVLMRQDNKWVKGRIIEVLENYPRSYVLETEKGKYRRNSIAIKHTSISFNPNKSQHVDNVDNFDDFLENNYHVNLASQRNSETLLSNSSQEINVMCSNVNDLNVVNVDIHGESSVENPLSCENVPVELPPSSLSSLNQNDMSNLEINQEIDDHEDNWYDTTAVSNDEDSNMFDTTVIEQDHDYLQKTRKGRIVKKPRRFQY